MNGKRKKTGTLSDIFNNPLMWNIAFGAVGAGAASSYGYGSTKLYIMMKLRLYCAIRWYVIVYSRLLLCDVQYS
jgi:hypothetical protein